MLSCYGFEIDLPDGWTLAEVEGQAAVTLTFTIGGSTTSTTAEDFGVSVFSAIKDVSLVPPYNSNGNAPYDSFEDATSNDAQGKIAGWSYELSDDFMDYHTMNLKWSGDSLTLFIG